jgi:hypothetical protein
MSLSVGVANPGTGPTWLQMMGDVKATVTKHNKPSSDFQQETAHMSMYIISDDVNGASGDERAVMQCEAVFSLEMACGKEV